MERVVEGRWPWPGREMTPEGSGDESSEGEQGWEDGDGDVDVEGDGDGMVVDLAMEIDIDGRPRPLKKRKVRKKSKDKDKDLGRPNPKGTVDLGPLVGVKRGFRTREKVPMSGGWCGVEVVPSSLAAFPELGTDGEENLPGTRKGKGKGKKAWKGKTKVDEVVLKPGVPDKDDRMDVDDSTATIPPRMRKPWVQSPASQSELSEDHSPRDHRQGAEIWGWRSPPETSAESPVSVSGADVEGNIGQDQGVTARSANVNGNGHDGADGQDGANGQDAEFDTDTEADGVDDTRQMPPPPMPASLDPTTVSSLAHACGGRSASPRLPVQWEKSGSPRVSTTWIPPQVPTPTSATIARTSQSPNQTHHPVTPALSYTSVPASSPPPLVHQHDALSSVSLPSPAHAEAQPHPSALAQTQPLAQAQLLPPTVSPSAPFSQLSLHSPDAASLFPHQSILFGSGEGTFLSPASAPAPESTYSIARKRVSSPPPHKPSKPLHVHPQNEPPSVSTPASVPVVRIESPDAIRDTPTQAQHQHRSSPESPHHALASPDAEKARTAEAHRVRFASPEVLSGLSGLTERAGMGDIKDADVSVEDDVVQVDGDAMDVDVDVVGDESSGDGSGPGHRPSFDRRRLHRISKDEPQPLHAATSPRSEAQFLPQSLTLPEPIHSPAPEHDSSPPSPQTQPHPPSESESELMLSEPEPPQPPREASPPPPPKVKMSLKDFALRKKKQREEEMAAKALTSPGSSDDHGLPPSPNVDGKRDLVVDNAGGAEENEEKVGFREVVNDVDVQMKDATVAHARDVSFPSVNGNVVNVELNGRDDDDPSVPPKPPKPVQDQQTPRVEKKTSGVMVIAPPPDAAQPSPRFAPPLTPLPRASGESTVQTQINGRTDAAPVTLKAKVEMMDSVIPSGLVAAYGDCAADAVSFAPEPPPPPLTTKQTSDANVAEGRRTTAPASTPTSSINSRSTSTGITVSAPSHSNHVPHAHIPTSIPLSRKPSHEDGEITSSTPPKTYLPRSYTPPTQPRSFHATHPPSPNLGPTSSSSSSSSAPAPRRPAPPPLSRSPLSNAAGPAPVPISSRPLPSGPRALRGSMSQPTQPPPYASTRPPYVGSQYIPRGPSADRDRLDWDRDRQWAASSRSRGRAGSNGWGR
ncbi:hypothetical protein PAXINDRAFT_9131 [Paxillus involutus ATCC 200175]|nr:hypothetical protein PAXINDRAFT_9131 [Paxillus involutus ATCC 200175]